jgi:hypothetical protein
MAPRIILALIAGIIGAAPAAAQFDASCLAGLRSQAAAAGISSATLDSAMRGLARARGDG